MNAYKHELNFQKSIYYNRNSMPVAMTSITFLKW